MPVQVRPAVPETASGDNRPFWAIFYAKKTARRELRRGFIAFQVSLFSAGFTAALFSHLAPHSAGTRVQRRTRPELQ